MKRSGISGAGAGWGSKGGCVLHFLVVIDPVPEHIDLQRKKAGSLGISGFRLPRGEILRGKGAERGEEGKREGGTGRGEGSAQVRGSLGPNGCLVASCCRGLCEGQDADLQYTPLLCPLDPGELTRDQEKRVHGCCQLYSRHFKCCLRPRRRIHLIVPTWGNGEMGVLTLYPPHGEMGGK